MSADLDAIRSRIDIVDLVSERVKLTRSGKSLRGLCPFHSEKTPSFYVYPEKGRFFCFGCQATGDVFTWVMRTQGLDFRPAVEFLARKAGVALTRRGLTAADEKERLYELLEEVALFFREQLAKGEAAFRYVGSRGLSAEASREWEIGFAPDDSESLISFLKRKQISLTDAVAVGLLRGSQAVGFQPFFQGRLMFPIRNERGRIIAFGGRSLFGKEPKYLNSPDSSIFSKSQTLFALNRAKSSIMSRKRIVVVEGYLDAIACHRAGVTEAVAPLGTALNERHAAVIARLCDRAVLAYDGDAAGQKAAIRAASTLEVAGVSCRIVLMPPGADPDSFFSEHGAPALIAAIDGGVTPLEFELEALKAKHRVASGRAGAEFWREAVRLLASSKDFLEADRLAVVIAPLHENARYDLRATIASIRKEVAAFRAKSQRSIPPKEQPGVERADVRELLPPPAERVLLRAAIRPEFRAAVWSAICEDGVLVSAAGCAIATKLKDVIGEDVELDPGSVMAALDEDTRNALAAMERPSQGPVTDKVVADALRRLQRERELRERRQRLSDGGSDEELLEYVRSRGSNDV